MNRLAVKGGTQWKVKTKNTSENLFMNLKRVFQRMVDIGYSKISKLGLSLLAIWIKFVEVNQKLRTKISNFVRRVFARMEADMIGPVEKGIAAARLKSSPLGIYEGVDFRTLPKFVSFRAALLREKVTDKFVILILTVLLISHYGITRSEISGYQEQLRMKQFVVVPGAVNFATVSPHSVKDSEIRNYVIKYLSLLGNVNSRNIDENYSFLIGVMSSELALRFELEAESWISSVKKDNVTETMTIKEKEIISDGTGFYKITVLATKDIYASRELVNSYDEVIEMKLKLLPPSEKSAWYPQIVELERKSAAVFQKSSYGAK